MKITYTLIANGKFVKTFTTSISAITAAKVVKGSWKIYREGANHELYDEGYNPDDEEGETPTQRYARNEYNRLNKGK